MRLSSYAVTGTTHGLQGDQDYTDEADGDFIGSKTKPWQTLVSRILDNTEVHIVPTINPDGWDRAEEGLCSGQVQGVPYLMLLCHVPKFSILYVLCVWMSPLAMCLMSCFLKPWIFFFCRGKKLHECYFTLKNVSTKVSNGCNFASQDFNSGRLNQNKIDINRSPALFF